MIVYQGNSDESWKTIAWAPPTFGCLISIVALGRGKQAVDDLEERGLPAARRPDDADELALGDVEVDPLDRPAAARRVAWSTYSIRTPRAWRAKPCCMSTTSAPATSRDAISGSAILEPPDGLDADDPGDGEEQDAEQGPVAPGAVSVARRMRTPMPSGLGVQLRR